MKVLATQSYIITLMRTLLKVTLISILRQKYLLMESIRYLIVIAQLFLLVLKGISQDVHLALSMTQLTGMFNIERGDSTFLSADASDESR